MEGMQSVPHRLEVERKEEEVRAAVGHEALLCDLNKELRVVKEQGDPLLAPALQRELLSLRPAHQSRVQSC